jgi:molybdopterin-containing oxidoreductase family membrane subunit
MNNFIQNYKNFVTAGLRYSLSGSRVYHLWMGSLTLLMIMGAFFYSIQLDKGLVVTGMNDYVSWGLYISNFTFLVGLAAAAVMLVIPAYIFSDHDFHKVVLIGEGVAVGALIMCLGFVTADMGGPHRLWHIIPKIGYFNWPESMLAWDVIVLNGYLVLNIFIPMYILYETFHGRKPKRKYYLPFVFLSVFWALGIHLVTAFLYAGLPARPFWNNALLGPRFLASAFAGGPAFILVLLGAVKKFGRYSIDTEVIKKLALIITVAAQINLIMLGSEIFKEFYNVTEHSISAVYLFFGVGKYNALVPWIWTSIALNVIVTVSFTFHKIRNNPIFLYPGCVLLFIAIWIDKGMGLIIPGFIPSPLGEFVEYQPTMIEIGVSIGIWALGLFILSILVRLGFAIEQGHLRAK